MKVDNEKRIYVEKNFYRKRFDGVVCLRSLGGNGINREKGKNEKMKETSKEKKERRRISKKEDLLDKVKFSRKRRVLRFRFLMGDQASKLKNFGLHRIKNKKLLEPKIETLQKKEF